MLGTAGRSSPWVHGELRCTKTSLQPKQSQIPVIMKSDSVAPPRGHVAGLLASLNDDTDLRIKLGDFTWKIHSTLMAARSPFFAVIVNGQWKESKTNHIELHDDNPQIFARFIQFVYCDDYYGNLVGTRSEDIKNHLTMQKLLGKSDAEPNGKNDILEGYTNYRVMHFQVYELADKYGCHDLKDLARSNIARDFHWSQEMDNLEAMIKAHDLSYWMDIFEKDEKLKAIFAEKFATFYRSMETRAIGDTESSRASTEASTGASPDDETCYPMQEWLRWLKEDHSFCLMVIDAMSNKY